MSLLDGNSTILVTSCNHKFHAKCIIQYAKKNTNHCPICGTTIEVFSDKFTSCGVENSPTLDSIDQNDYVSFCCQHKLHTITKMD